MERLRRRGVSMTREQKIVALGAGSGVITMIISIFVIFRLIPSPQRLADTGSHLAYALQVNLVAVLPLLVGIMWVGNGRFLSEAIDPTLGKEDRAQVINGRVVET